MLEDHNHFIDQLSMSQLRVAILAAGGKLMERGSIGAVEDVFWLRLTDVLGGLRAQDAPGLRALVLERQAEHAVLEALEAPPLLGAPDPKLPPRPPLKDERTPLEDSTGALLRGQGASPGRRRGRARIVPTADLRPDLRPGDVLVAESSSPCWTPLFPVLAGVVLDQGVLTQHSATTTREYGIPAVFRTGHATRRIPDGAWVVVDGTAGTVEIEEPEAPSA